MNLFEPYISFFSEEWKEKYAPILVDEHLSDLSNTIKRFKDGMNDFQLPHFNEETLIQRSESFSLFIDILDRKASSEMKTISLENLAFEHWLNILGQRITSASIRDESAIPPLRSILIDSCEKLFNQEITTAQRAWEKHVGRMDDQFWGEVKGNNKQKQAMVMEKINHILDNRTWWNVFFHYKHQLVFEIREKEGHGIRWSHGGTQLIGFLEPFINE
ncbi:hypothetical protein VUJ46_19295 [Chryseobacterium sp. MYb264]|uniref:hypothetical protein n=1 Tax=Chryseobacterium sp. MYb264 TaxID=2745153 RepID=UPI002E111E15|nr:hypothetical protein VUJ46_19295 [Chryseobacterium sp. MYb264]